MQGNVQCVLHEPWPTVANGRPLVTSLSRNFAPVNEREAHTVCRACYGRTRGVAVHLLRTAKLFQWNAEILRVWFHCKGTEAHDMYPYLKRHHFNYLH